MPRPRLPLPSQKYLQDCFNYDPGTGVLRWKHRPRSHFTTDQAFISINARQVEKIAGTPHYRKRFNNVVVELQIAGQTYIAARIIVKMILDIEPEDADHEDGDATNNKWLNLRPCTHASNVKNKSVYKSNKLGIKGVSYSKWKKGYMVDIQNNKIKYQYGPFTTVEEASAVYQKAAEELHGEFARTD